MFDRQEDVKQNYYQTGNGERKDTLLENNSMDEIDEDNLADKEDNVGNGNAEELDEEDDDFDSNRSKLNSESNSRCVGGKP